MPDVAPARFDAADRVTDDLVAAFADDPLQEWIFPDPAGRRRYGRPAFALEVGRLMPGGLVWRTDGAAAVWAAPDAPKAPLRDQIALALRLVPGLGLRHARRVQRAIGELERRHPSQPHAYLSLIGVAPAARGQGLGMKLLAPGLAWADARGLPCFLESSNPRNVTFYERAGFAATGTLKFAGDGPVMTLMWRPPAS